MDWGEKRREEVPIFSPQPLAANLLHFLLIELLISPLAISDVIMTLSQLRRQSRQRGHQREARLKKLIGELSI